MACRATERLAALLETHQDLSKQHRASELHVQHLLGKAGRLESELVSIMRTFSHGVIWVESSGLFWIFQT